MFRTFSCHRAVLLAALLLGTACATGLHSTLGRRPTPAELAAFWAPPDRSTRTRAFFGSGGPDSAPSPDAVYTLVEEKKGGFSPKVEVVDPSGRQWGVKMGPEAQSEVTVSRILWMLGYRQPPGYCLVQWRIKSKDGVHVMGPGRFRPHLEWIEGRGTWSWYSNPFVDSEPFRGLIVLMMVLNSTDLKQDNNEIYRVRKPGGATERWYAVRDLGASLGETGWTGQRRNDIDQFEKQKFITGVKDGRVTFEFHGRFHDLLNVISPADVRWACEKVDRLTEAQWREAFRAGAYDEATTARYLAKIREKVQQGLALQGDGSR